VTHPQATEPDGERYSPYWLTLREGADADARSGMLLDAVRDRLTPAPDGRPTVIHDLGCGSGSQGRWLAPRLPGRQRWVLHDRDPDLLALAAAAMPAAAADGAPVTAEVREHDVTAVTVEQLAGASLVTGSALLDLFTRAEVERIATACHGAGAPALFTLSVLGRVELDPADPLDAAIGAAFDAHQRRDTGRGPLLGPDAAGVAAGAFARLGAEVRIVPSPWLLGPEHAPLIAEWLRGWVGAATEQRPDLAPDLAADLATAGYLRSRLELAAAGRLRVVVRHADLLATWD
jgi:hypothetical protein